MLHLRTAVAAARREDRSATTDLLDRAESAAQRMGVDGNHWRTSFGPTNVAVHRVSAALDLGDVAGTRSAELRDLAQRCRAVR